MRFLFATAAAVAIVVKLMTKINPFIAKIKQISKKTFWEMNERSEGAR